jgi:hypothetical protein
MTMILNLEKILKISISTLIIISATNIQYAICKRLTLNSFRDLNLVQKWFVLTLNSLKALNLE